MEIRCPLVNQNLLVDTNGAIKFCCDMTEVKMHSSDTIVSQKTHSPLQAFHSIEFDTIRKNLKNGIRDPHCNKCWEAENNGVESQRLIELNSDDRLQQETVELTSMTLSIGNTCNLKCRTCGPVFSTTWLKEDYDLNHPKQITFKEFRNQNTVKMSDNLDFYQSLINDVLPNLKELNFIGGEPFMISDLWRIVESIIEQHLDQQITLNIVTNSTIWEEKKEKILSQIKNVNLILSIDGIGQRFEYLRHPAKWQTVHANIMKMVEWRSNHPTANLIVNPIVSSYNVWYLQEIIDYANQYNLEIYFRNAAEPTSMNTVNIPESIKEQLVERVPKSVSDHFLSKQSDSQQWQEFLSTVNLHDNYRKESFGKTFEDYAKLINFVG